MTISNTCSRALTAVAVAAVAFGGLAACSGSDDSAKASSGEILLGTMQPISSTIYSTTLVRDGAEAAIEAINAKGGVNGQKLKLETCDTSFDANKELSCTRELVDDGVAALVAPMLMVDQTGRSHALADKAGIPMIGARGIVLADMQSPNSFPSTSGLAGWSYGAVASLVNAGSKKISILVDDNPASQGAKGLLEAAVTSAGMEPVNVVTADPKADPTYTSSAAKAIGGADGIALAIAPNNYPKSVQAVRRAGYTGPISNISSLMTPENLKTLGKDAEGLMLSSHFTSTNDTTDPEMKRFADEMKKYKPKTAIDDGVLAGWVSIQLFAKAMADVDDIDAKKTLDTFKNLAEPIDMGGVMAPYKVKGNESPVKDQPRMFNPFIRTIVIENGTYKPVGDFLDPFSELSGSAK